MEGLLRYYYPPLSLNNPLIRPYFLGGGSLDSHDIGEAHPNKLWCYLSFQPKTPGVRAGPVVNDWVGVDCTHESSSPMDGWKNNFLLGWSISGFIEGFLKTLFGTGGLPWTNTGSQWISLKVQFDNLIFRYLSKIMI